MNFFSIIKKIDYFGPTVQFTIRNEANFKTFFGGILSIIYIIIYILVLYSFLGEFYNKENPNVMIFENYKDVMRPFEIDNGNFFMAFRLSEKMLSSVKLTFDDLVIKAYTVEIPNFSYISKKIKKEIDIVKCSEVLDFTNLFIDFISNPLKLLSFSNLIKKNDSCIKFKQNETYSLQGNIVRPPHSYLNIDIALNPNKNVCSKINDLKNSNVSHSLLENQPTILNVNFNPSDYEKPFDETFGFLIDYLHSDIKTSFSQEFMFDYHLLNQDDGFFFSNEKKISKFSLNKNFKGVRTKTLFDFDKMDNYCKNKNKDYLEQQENLLISLKFLVNTMYYNEYFRVYKKLQDFLGDVNGVMDVLNKIFFLVIYFYSNYRLDYFLINSNINIRDGNNLNNDGKNKFSNLEDIDSSKLKSFRMTVLNPNNPKSFQIQGSSNKNQAKTNSILNINSNDNSKSSRISISNIFQNDVSKIYSNNLANIDIKKKPKIDNNNNNSNNNKNNNNYSDSNSNRILNASNKHDEIRKKENDINQKIKKLMEPKVNFLTPNIINYYFCCQRTCRMDKKRLLQVKLLSYFSEKINKKMDILYYFKLIKKLKSLQHLFFNKKEHLFLFDMLNMDLYSLKYQEICNDKFFKPKEKNKKQILIERYSDFFKYLRESDDIINEKFVEKLDQLI